MTDTLTLAVDRRGLAALKAICGCAATDDARPALQVVRFTDTHVSATDSYVAAHVPLTLLGDVWDEPEGLDVSVPAAVLKHALWKLAKDVTAEIIVTDDQVIVRIDAAGYQARVRADDDALPPDLGALIQRAATLQASDDLTYVDAARMSQVAAITPNGTTVVSRGPLAATTVHDLVDHKLAVGCVMPVRVQDFTQPHVGEAPIEEPVADDDLISLLNREELEARDEDGRREFDLRTASGVMLGDREPSVDEVLEQVEREHPVVVIDRGEDGWRVCWPGEKTYSPYERLRDAQAAGQDISDGRGHGPLTWRRVAPGRYEAELTQDGGE